MLWAAISLIISYSEQSGFDFSNTGQWGDSFGSLNALFSAFGFTAIVITLFLQRKALKDQAEDLHRQRFESSFFELIALLRQLRSEIRLGLSNELQEYARARDLGAPSKIKARVKAHDAITAAVAEVRYWSRRQGGIKNVSKESIEEIFMRRVHLPNEHSIGPYFRNIYYILKKIKTDKVLTNDEKVQYSNLLRGQLSSHEVTLIAINGLAKVSNDLSDLLIHFRMLKYLPNDEVKVMLKRFYPKQAFMARGD
ncbi:putative phage abortive infection protein [Rubellimicrobium mesophilum]|uniref:putative phage abortive infection protein n=1 Tax=Rubellimicrobium mesophilum TaxID=1123067 RepID=UPI0012E312B3|nr:putative phage abortive infection protein [Rubellimicrobium mesophilum]